jgi:hypothetical protein
MGCVPVPVLCLLDLRGRLRRKNFHSVYAKKVKIICLNLKPKHSKEFVVLLCKLVHSHV